MELIHAGLFASLLGDPFKINVSCNVTADVVYCSSSLTNVKYLVTLNMELIMVKKYSPINSFRIRTRLCRHCVDIIIQFINANSAT